LYCEQMPLPFVALVPTRADCAADQEPLLVSESPVMTSVVPDPFISQQPSPMTKLSTVMVPVVTVGALLLTPVPTPPVE